MIQLARKTQDLIQDLCCQFGETTGWPLRYVAAGPESTEAIKARCEEQGLHASYHYVDDGENHVGLLILEFPADHPVDNYVEPVRALAEQIGQLLSQLAQMEQTLATRTAAVETLSGLGQSPQSEQSLGDNLHDLLAAAVRLTGYHSAGFYLLNPATNRLKLRAAYGLDARSLPATNREVSSSRPDLEALSRGFAFVNRQSELDDRWLSREARSGLCAVVQSSLVPIGTLWVYDRREHTSHEKDIESLRVVAGHIALLLERVVLLRESEAQRRIQKELRAVSDPESGLRRPYLSKSCGFDAVYRCLSRHEVGGDMCELEALTAESTIIVVGDASGNSVPAALVMNAAKGALKSMSGRRAAHDWHPSVAMDRLNRALHSITGEHQFMSLFYGVYDASTRLLTHCNAGHPAPILVRGGEVTLLEAQGLLLGIVEDVEYRSLESELQPGDLLVLLSDGITEIRDEEHRLFGVNGVVEAIRRASGESVENIFESIWQRAEEHAGRVRKRNTDDRTLLVMRIK